MDHINFLLLLVGPPSGSKKFEFQQLVEVGWRGIKLSDATVNFDHKVRRFMSGIFAHCSIVDPSLLN